MTGRPEGKGANQPNGSREERYGPGDWPSYGQFLLVVVIALVATLLFIFPPVLARLLGTSGPATENATLWIAPYVSLTAVLLSAIFLFMTLRIDRGARSEARKEAFEEAKKRLCKASLKKAKRQAKAARDGAKSARGRAETAQTEAKSAEKRAKQSEDGAAQAREGAETAKEGALTARRHAEEELGAGRLAARELEKLRSQAEERPRELLREAEAAISRLAASHQQTEEALAALEPLAESLTAAAARPVAEEANRELDERVRSEVADQLSAIRGELRQSRRWPWSGLRPRNED